MKSASPSDISECLRAIADRLDGSTHPSVSKVSAAIGTVLGAVERAIFIARISSDKSMSLAIRESLFEEVQKLVPGEFDRLYDTNEGGKGRKGMEGRIRLLWPSAHVVEERGDHRWDPR